jgi:3-hydroxyacyl-[acyl-carrier-protein] dehydratase
MPLNNLYTYKLIFVDPTSIEAGISIDPGHIIFGGHFPGHPVVPGVAQIEMIREIISAALRKELRLTEARDIKYISPILKAQMNDVQLMVNYNFTSENITVNCVLSGKDIVFTKIRATFYAA